MDPYGDIPQSLQTFDPAELFGGLFACAPVGIQIYGPDGRCLLTNKAFRDLFGSEPEPDYNLFRNDAQRRLAELVRRAFDGETATVPPAWYGAPESAPLPVRPPRRMALSASIFPILDGQRRVAYVGVVFRDDTTGVLATEQAEAARVRAEAAKHRMAFLANASAAISESLDLGLTLARVARLAVPAIADWCTATIFTREGRFQRVAVVHRDPQKRALAEEYLEKFPAERHGEGSMYVRAFATGKPVLVEHVDPPILRRFAQSPDHLRILQGLGITSCLMVPLLSRQRRSLGVLAFAFSDGTRSYGEDDISLAESLSARVALGVENALLYEAERAARALAQTERDESAELARGSQIAQDQLRALVENLPELAWSADAGGEFEFFNRRWYEYTGTTPEQMCTYGWQAVLGPEWLPRVLEIWHRTISSGTPLEMELPLPGADGQDRWFLMRVQPIRDAQGAIVRWIGTNTDIDQQRRQAALLEEAVRTRDTFLSVASHELKTPLTPMALRLHALAKAVDAEPPSRFTQAVRAYTSTATRQIARLTSLINDLLDVSRIAAGRFTLEAEDMDIPDVVRDVAARLEPEAARAGSALVLALPDSLPSHLDRLRIEQVVTNLLDNAIKYGAGRPIRIELTGTQTQVRLSVMDEGIGIEPESIGRIFDRFERAVSDRHYGGLGLGLYITRRILDAMGGTIHVRSVPGRGATFLVELPRTSARLPAGAALDPPGAPSP